MMTTPKNIKLTYFDIEGAAEPVRLALILSGTDFTDVCRLERSQTENALWSCARPDDGRWTHETAIHGPLAIGGLRILRNALSA